MTDKYDYKSAEHAHWRIDELRAEFKSLKTVLTKMSESQAKTEKHSNSIKWILFGGAIVYVLDHVGLLGAIKIFI